MTSGILDVTRVRVARWELVALAAIVAASLLAQRLLSPGCCEGPDLVAYLDIANQQSSNPGFWMDPTAFEGNFWAMLYPTFLHYALVVTGGSMAAVQWIQMVLAASLALGAWLLAFHLGRTIRIATAVVVAVSPATMFLGSSFGYEILLAWLITASMVLAWTRAIRGTDTSLWARVIAPLLSGVLLGLAVLAQSKVLVVVPVVAYLLWRQQLSRALWGAVGLLLPLVPWMVRNLIVLGSPSPLTHNGPYNLWVGNNPDATTGGSMLVAPPLPAGLSDQTQAALRWIVEQPEIAIQLMFRKAMRLWEPQFLYPELIPPGVVRTGLHLYAGAVAFTVLAGLLIFLGARFFSRPPELPNVTPLAVAVALFYGAHLPFIAEPRFMSSVFSLTAAVSTATLIFLMRRFRSSLVGRSA